MTPHHTLAKLRAHRLAGGKVRLGFGRLLMQLWDNIAAGLAIVGKPLFYSGHAPLNDKAQLPAAFENYNEQGRRTYHRRARLA